MKLRDTKAKAQPAAPQLVVVDTCGLCHWWAHGGSGYGRCRRFPPTVMPGSAGTWPLTQAEDYCGEFADKLADAGAAPVGFAPAKAGAAA